MPNANKWFANPLQAQSAARAGVPATSVSRQSQTNRPALARNVAAGQQASAGPAGMATAGYGAAGQGIPPTSSRFGSQSNLGQLNDMSAGPNDPLFGDQFDMGMDADLDDDDTGMGGPRPQPFPGSPAGPWMPGDPRPSPYQRPIGRPLPITQPTTPATPAPWLKDRGGNQFGQLTGAQQQGGQVPFDQRGPGLGGISREEAASSPFKGWNALGGQQAVSSLEGHRASQEARATGQTPFNQRGPGKSVGVMGPPGAQGQPGPGGGYNPQSDIGGFFGRPQPPPMPSTAGYGPGYDMSEMLQFDPMHPGMYTPPGTGSSQAIPANPPPIVPIPPGGLPGFQPVGPDYGPAPAEIQAPAGPGQWPTGPVIAPSGIDPNMVMGSQVPAGVSGPMGDPGAAGAAGIGGDEFGGMPDMGIAGGPSQIDLWDMKPHAPANIRGESGYNFPTPVIPNQRPIGPLPPKGLPDIDIDPISYTPPASLSPEEVMELTTFGGGSGGALMRPQMIGKPQDLAPWSGGPGDPFAGRPRPPRPPRPTPTGPQPRIRGPGNPYPSGSTPASRRRARERGGNPNDLRTGQGVSLGSDPRLHALAVGSGALPARPPRLTAGMWPGMV